MVVQKKSILYLVENDLLELHDTYKAQNWSGADPYEFVWRFNILGPIFPPEGIYYLLDGYLGPSFTNFKLFRRILGIHAHHESKALSIFARGYSLLKSSDINIEQEKVSTHLCKLLWNLRNKETQYPSWGLGFYWNTGKSQVLPPNSPTALITALAGLAFMNQFETTKKDIWLTRAKQAALYLTRSLGFTTYEDGSLCFWYTPITKKNIPNASAIAAFFLNNLAKITGEKEFSEFGDNAIKLLLQTQHECGGWNYFLDVPPAPHLFDNYHTGFIIESLLRYDGKLNNEVEKACRRGLEFYESLFNKDGSPFFHIGKKYPIDIHDISQGILVFSLAQMKMGFGLDTALRIWDYSRKWMKKQDGTYRSRRYRIGVSESSYPRWADSWMMLALATLYSALKQTNWRKP